MDFDTLDLLTKRVNSKKKYCPFSKMVFDDLNRISDIPIHRTSNKNKKIGSGVIRKDYKKNQALVKWLGYSDDFNSWIPLSNLQELSN